MTVKRIIGGVVVLVAIFAAYVWYAMQGNDVPAGELEEKYRQASERFIDIDGARVRVREEGPEGAETILLLHGFTASLESWDDWTADLARDYRVIRYDLLGHGLTGPDPQKRYAPLERAAFLGAVMDALEIEQAHIGGNSLGGLVAWRFASMKPDRVASLLLVSPGVYSINGVEDTPLEAPAAIKMFLKMAPEAGVRAMLERQFGDPTRLDPARVPAYRDMMIREGNGDAFIEHIAAFTMPDPTEALGRVSSPVLILWGSLDATIPVEHAGRMHEALANSRLEIMEGAGHMVQEELPVETLALVRDFLGKGKAAND